MVIKVEGFEGLTNTGNSPLTGPYFQVGVITPYVFGTGVIHDELNPNLQGHGAFVADFSQGAVFFDLGANGIIDSVAEVPTDSAFMLRDSLGGLSFAFSQKVYVVGGFVTAHSDSSPGLIAYDKKGNVVDVEGLRSVAVADWDQNYIQVTSKKPIAAVQFTGDSIVLDDLTFNTSKPKIVKGTNANDNLTPDASNKGEYVNCRGGDDTVKTKGGDDTINCGKGNDKVNAGDGNDTIITGSGRDILRGGADQDTFWFNILVALPPTGSGSATGGVPKIKDFSAFDDTIALSNEVFTGLTEGTLFASQFHSGSAAADIHHRIIYDPATGDLLWDSDGIGAAAAVKFASLSLGSG